MNDEFINPEIVQNRVDEIRKVRHDDERAHALEAQLRSDVLYAIATDQVYDPKECARLAANTDVIDFSRWYG